VSKKSNEREGADDPVEPTEPVVHDKRRIDPDTGQVRQQDAPAGDADDLDDVFVTDERQAEGDALEASIIDLEAGLVSDLEVVQADLAERTADLQRLHAEYSNYRKRVERDRELVREQAVAGALGELLPVLDDLGRAREHGELEGAFKAVGEAVEAVVARAGIEAFGSEGDRFDPNLHEALMHEHSAEVSEPTCVTVFRKGYRKGDRILRAAQVVVADPE
jgi:molecular chaperone GrpE